MVPLILGNPHVAVDTLGQRYSSAIYHEHDYMLLHSFILVGPISASLPVKFDI